MRLGVGELTMHYRAGQAGDPFACGERNGCITGVIEDVTCKACKGIRELAMERNFGQEPDVLHMAYEREIQRMRPLEDRLMALENRVRAVAVEYQREPRWIRTQEVGKMLEEWL